MDEEMVTPDTSSYDAFGLDAPILVASPQQMTKERIHWPGEPAIKQSFPLPKSIIYYIAMNPLSAKGYLKLVESCKYFFETNPIIVAFRVHGDSKMCSKTFNECKKNEGKCCVNYDINKLSSKIWLTEELILDVQTIPNIHSMLCSKIYRTEIRRLSLVDTVVTLDNFKILVSSVKFLYINNVEIIKNDESVVSIDEVLEYFPKLKNFCFCFSDVESTSTIKSMAKLNYFGHLELLVLFHIPEILTVDNLSNFMSAHEEMIVFLDFVVLFLKIMNSNWMTWSILFLNLKFLIDLYLMNHKMKTS